MKEPQSIQYSEQASESISPPSSWEHSGRLPKPILNLDESIAETSEDHRDRLFLQVLFGLGLNVVALLVIFYTLLPLSQQGKDVGGTLLWSIMAATVSVALLFQRFGMRIFFVNLLLVVLSTVLVAGNFMLGGTMSPTMIFLLVIPVLAATLMNRRWAFCWTAITVALWLLVLVLENQGFETRRITIAANVGSIQVLSLLGTGIIIMSVLSSYVNANSRLRAAMEAKNKSLDYLASHDSLTSIPNRRALFEHAQQCIMRGNRSGKPFALLVIDLNDFKQINDSLGHSFGDEVLTHFAKQLKTGFRETDFVARLGGDEFGVVLEPVEGLASVQIAVERFFRDSDNEVEIDGQGVRYECSTGIAMYPQNGETIASLYEEADHAMYRAKRNAPGEFLWR
ncbi:MAG: GGDEF domain-containing protein [Halioglobus sp.]